MFHLKSKIIAVILLALNSFSVAFADISTADSSGMTALMAAASNDSVATIKLLIKLGANLYAVDVEGGTAVDWAIAGNAKKAERFLRKQVL